MVEQADVVVVGGGVMGLSTAFYLTQGGVRSVLVLEKRTIGSGASGISGAIISAHYSIPVLCQLTARSLDVWHNFDAVVGGDCGFVNSGRIGVGPAHSAEITRNIIAEVQVPNGIPAAEIGLEELRERAPGIRTDDVGVAFWEPRAGYADPVATLEAFAAAARRGGAEIREGVKVLRIRTQGGRVVGVDTSAGSIDAQAIVNVANVWASEVSETTGVSLPITPQRAQIGFFRLPPGFSANHPITGDFCHNVYLRPSPWRTTLVGKADYTESEATPQDPDTFDQGADRATIGELRQRAMQRYPAFAVAPTRGAYAGLYDVSPDSHLFIDQVPGIQGFYVAAGFSGDGFKFSPTVGEILSRLVIDQTFSPIDISPLRLGRFAENQPLRGLYSYPDSPWNG